MKKISKLTIIILLVTLIFLMSCDNKCNSKKSNKVTLTIWASEEDQEMLKQMCNSFAMSNKDQEYEFLFGVEGEGDIADKVLNDVTEGPDVYSFASDQIYKLYAGGALSRIGGENETKVKEMNTEGSVDAATITIKGEDQLFAYPSTGDNCYFLYYDKRVYSDLSKVATLDSILDLAASSGKKFHFKLNDDGWYLSSFFFAKPSLKYNVTYNENMVEEKVDINFDSNDGLEVMKSLRNYINHDAMVAQTDDSKIVAAFTPDANGKTIAAACVSGTWNAKTLKGLLGDNLGVAKLPTAKIAGEQTQLSGFMGYKLIGVNGYSKNKAEAHKLALWLTNEQNQLKRFEVRGFAPTNKKIAENSVIKNDPVISAVLLQAQYNRTQKGVPSNYWTPMASVITPIITAKDQGKTISDNELLELLKATSNAIRK